MANRKRQPPRGKKIIPKVIGQNISKELITRHQNEKEIHPKDKTYLMYDAHVTSVLERLKEIKGTKLLASNPTIEYWFLLHYKNQTARIIGDECIKELCNRNRNTYKKGVIDDKLKQQLDTKQNEACKRAQKTTLFQNPSSNIHQFIEDIEEAKSNI